MNAERIQKSIIAVMILAITLMACAPFEVQAGQPNPTATPQSTSVPTIPAPTQTPLGITPAPDGGASHVITLDNNNQLITLHPGETFLLKLGDTYQWEPVIDNQAVVSRVPNIMVIRGAQGLYSAHQAGTATMTASGDPLCRQTTPACAMPSLIFTLHIEVLP